MMLKTLPVEEAVGCALPHDLTRIIPGEFKGAAFKKGHIIRAEDIPALKAIGKEHIFVAEQEAGMVHEDEAAERLARLCMGANVKAAPPSEGKIEIFAAAAGFFEVNRAAINTINGLGELAVAVRRPFTPVNSGDKLAGVKAIPLFIAEEKLALAEKLPPALLSVRPWTVKNACVIVTGTEIAQGRIEDKFTAVLEKKLASFGITIRKRIVVEDGADNVSAAITEAEQALREAASPAASPRAASPAVSPAAEGIIFCTGGMSVDPDDSTPAAIRRAAACVVSYGAPVFPGAMFMLAYLANGVAVCGLPGCVMFAKTTIFDVILPHLAAGKRVDSGFIAGMGLGGLCLGCDTCTFPVCSFGTAA